MSTSHASAPRHWVPEWEFGDRLRKVRTSMGLGQVEFAEHIDLTAPTLAAYETGRANPRSKDLPSLAARLEMFTGVPRQWFLGWETDTPQSPKKANALGRQNRDLLIHWSGIQSNVYDLDTYRQARALA